MEPREFFKVGHGAFDTSVDPFMAISSLSKVLNSARLWSRPGG